MMASVLATFAQFERRLIGQRTKDALAVKRAQGVRLGRPREMSPETVERIHELHRSGLTPTAIARELNRQGVPTARGGRWHPARRHPRAPRDRSSSRARRLPIPPTSAGRTGAEQQTPGRTATVAYRWSFVSADLDNFRPRPGGNPP